IKDGRCWWYRKYPPGDTTLKRLEAEAREGRKGLWADSQPVPPWGSGGSEKESDDASQGTAQLVQDAITG
ncbi:MAG: thermonuclease family protein, partial [Nitrospiraceae bacterium]